MSNQKDDPAVVEMITQAMVTLLLNKPFFGQMAIRLKPVDATAHMPTAATDGRRLYYNRDFIKSLKPSEVVFLIAHEVLHCVYDHIGRMGSRDPKIHNMAIDYVVNYTLVSQGVGSMPGTGLYDPKYTDEFSSEEIYELLMKNAKNVDYRMDEHLSDKDDDGDKKKKDGKGASVSVTVMGDDGPPKLSDSEMDDIRNEIRNAVLSAAANCSAGDIPAGVRRLIDEFTDPVMDWRLLLEMHIQSSIKDDFTFMRPNRRSYSCGCILPGQNFADTVDVAVAIDTSGSMTDEMLRDFLSEVMGIMQTFDDFKLTLWTFDTRVYNPQVFTPANVDELINYVPEGGGGTMFEANWEFMRDPAGYGFDDPELGDVIEPKKFVMFTDGYPNSTWGEENYCDTLFIIHGNNTIVAPFGMTGYYDKNDIRNK